MLLVHPCWPGALADQAPSCLFGAVFNNATALSNSEAATLMNIVLEVRKQADPAYTPNPVMQKTLEYAGMTGDWYKAFALQPCLPQGNCLPQVF